MILLWGIFPDRPLTAVYAALGRRGVSTFVLDQMNVAQTQIELQVGAAVTGSIRVGAAACDLSAVSAVYVRCYDSRALNSAASDVTPAQRRHAREVDDIVTNWLGVTPAFIVNPLSAMASNSSKPYQLSLIHAAGFATPDTLLSTDPDAVRVFWERHGQVIYKSISGVRSIVSRLKAEDGDRLDDIRWCPTQFQQYVPGRDYRVHVVGDELFACKIVSQADDYRYGARQDMAAELRACTLPADCAHRCRALAQSLGLVVAGIDLRRAPDGEWFCFEVNPSPAFTYYAAATGQPIAEAIAALLAPTGATRPITGRRAKSRPVQTTRRQGGEVANAQTRQPTTTAPAQQTAAAPTKGTPAAALAACHLERSPAPRSDMVAAPQTACVDQLLDRPVLTQAAPDL